MSSVRVDSKDTEDSGATADQPAPEAGDDNVDSPGGVVAQTEEYLRQHPLARMAIAFGIGALLQTALRAGAQRLAKGDEMPKGTEMPEGKMPQQNLLAEPRSARPRTHQFGAADMAFSAHHPDGKNVEFKFAWKKRPIDAPEDNWPIDEMGFTAVRPNGKQTAFTFKGKTRPIPDEKSAVGDSRPGLGEAKMEFTSSAPGRRDFKFTWKRVPPTAGPQDIDQPPEISHIGDGGSAALSAINRPEKTPAKKASQKKASKKSASGKPGKEKRP